MADPKAPKLSMIEVGVGGVPHTIQVDQATIDSYDEQEIPYRKVSKPRTGMEGMEPTGSAAASAAKDAEIADLKRQLAESKAAAPANKAAAPANK